MPQYTEYVLGQVGLDLVNSPIHSIDGHLLLCQNAQLSPNDAELALKKRDGMSKINASALAGTVLFLYNVPLEDPS
jgi:hypothetical protein